MTHDLILVSEDQEKPDLKRTLIPLIKLLLKLYKNPLDESCMNKIAPLVNLVVIKYPNLIFKSIPYMISVKQHLKETEIRSRFEFAHRISISPDSENLTDACFSDEANFHFNNVVKES